MTFMGAYLRYSDEDLVICFQIKTLIDIKKQLIHNRE